MTLAPPHDVTDPAGPPAAVATVTAVLVLRGPASALPETLDSLARQTRSPERLVVVDPGRWTATPSRPCGPTAGLGRRPSPRITYRHRPRARPPSRMPCGRPWPSRRRHRSATARRPRPTARLGADLRQRGRPDDPRPPARRRAPQPVGRRGRPQAARLDPRRRAALGGPAADPQRPGDPVTGCRASPTRASTTAAPTCSPSRRPACSSSGGCSRSSVGPERAFGDFGGRRRLLVARPAVRPPRRRRARARPCAPAPRPAPDDAGAAPVDSPTRMRRQARRVALARCAWWSLPLLAAWIVALEHRRRPRPCCWPSAREPRGPSSPTSARCSPRRGCSARGGARGAPARCAAATCRGCSSRRGRCCATPPTSSTTRSPSSPASPTTAPRPEGDRVRPGRRRGAGPQRAGRDLGLARGPQPGSARRRSS